LFFFAFIQREIKQQLRHNLSRLPKPKNDYEIVLPDTAEQSANDEQMDTTNDREEDQADIDQRRRADKRRQRMKLPNEFFVKIHSCFFVL